ncbi:hypothetical protein PAE4_20382 [Bacillus altitudinis]|nr:hypothetical protein PAE4_20382 [Bacillus altitudinis]
MEYFLTRFLQQTVTLDGAMFHVYSFLTKLGQILFTWIIAEVG